MEPFTSAPKLTAVLSGHINKQTPFPEVSLAGLLYVPLIRIVYTFVFLPSFNTRLSQLHKTIYEDFSLHHTPEHAGKLLLMPLPPMFGHIDK